MSQPIKQDNQAVESDRRTFLKTGAAVAGVVVAPGVLLYGVSQARPPTPEVPSKVRWGLLIDTTRCAAGCSECVTACRVENGLGGGTAPTDAQWIRKVEIRDRATGRQASLPVMCQHCAEPPCVDVCPTGASFKRADGIVLVDRHACIGCRYCVAGLPLRYSQVPVRFAHRQDRQVRAVPPPPQGRPLLGLRRGLSHRGDAVWPHRGSAG